MAYIKFNVKKDVGRLDINTFNQNNATVFPHHLYTGEPVNTAYYLCPTMPRDKATDYIIDREKQVHPDHFSRFAYAGCPNGYCLAQWPGRYIVPSDCEDLEEPADMAPLKYYGEEYLGPYVVRPAAYYASLRGRGGVLNL